MYPPKLSSGLPKRHHAVVYLHAKLCKSYTAEKLQEEINLAPDEVGASAWFDKKIIKAIVRTIEFEEKGAIPDKDIDAMLSGLPKSFQ